MPKRNKPIPPQKLFPRGTTAQTWQPGDKAAYPGGKVPRLMVALRDVKTGVFLSPLVVATPGEAERSYEEILKREGTLVSRFPWDFDLYEVGRYDEDSGFVHGLYNNRGVQQGPKLMLQAAQFGYTKPDVKENC